MIEVGAGEGNRTLVSACLHMFDNKQFANSHERPNLDLLRLIIRARGHFLSGKYAASNGQNLLISLRQIVTASGVIVSAECRIPGDYLP